MTTTPSVKTGLKVLEEWNKINLGQNTKNACALLKKHYKEYKYPIKVIIKYNIFFILLNFI